MEEFKNKKDWLKDWARLFDPPLTARNLVSSLEGVTYDELPWRSKDWLKSWRRMSQTNRYRFARSVVWELRNEFFSPKC